MKRYSLIVALHIIGIAFLSVGVYLLVDAGLWFSALMAFLILLAIAVHLYRLQMMQVRMMRHLAESLRYDDMMLSFRSPYKNRSMEDMVDELSEAMRNFRTRVLERNEMEAWQKLIRVLTHEIMNSITPIISLSETLSEREMSEKNYPVMRQGMQTIHRRSKGLLEFVENYRKLTRLPAPVRRPVAVRELLQDLQKLFSEEYIRIELPEADRILQIDRTQIEQVLINLIKNAKYMRFERTAQGIAIGFAGRVAFIARVHQYGLRDKVEKDGPTVQYASRELLGFTAEEMDMIETEVINFISK